MKIEAQILASLDRVNGALDSQRFVYSGRDTDSGHARVEQYDDNGFYRLCSVGSPRECLQFVNGLSTALAVTNWLD